MKAEVVNFYSHWKAKQERLRKSLGYPSDLWYCMLDNGYEPTNSEDVDKFIEELNEDE
jgi:hypothetical protein|tara:strand:+ start:357 stop:530 length:174 start_codon:yes stop_codon:yes gene_type:complete